MLDAGPLAQADMRIPGDVTRAFRRGVDVESNSTPSVDCSIPDFNGIASMELTILGG